MSAVEPHYSILQSIKNIYSYKYISRYLKEMANVRKRENQIRLVHAAAKAAAMNPIVGRISPPGFPKYTVKRLLHNSTATMAVPKMFEIVPEVETPESESSPSETSPSDSVQEETPPSVCCRGRQERLLSLPSCSDMDEQETCVYYGQTLRISSV